MQYFKKMCVLRQVKQGFSGDGRPLSGLIKAEQYGKNLAVEISAVGFAPLSSGVYYCLIADGKGRTETLPMRGKTTFNLISDLDISGGFCGVICFVKNEILPVAYGVNGDGKYDIKALAAKALLKVEKPQKPKEEKRVEEAATSYDDERLAEENYFEKEEGDECGTIEKGGSHVRVEGGNSGEEEDAREGAQTYADGEDVLHAFTTDSDGFYQSIKPELDELFEKYPRDTVLENAFACSRWVRVRGEEGAPDELIGVIYEHGKAKYICYAVPAMRSAPPKELEGAGFFIPLTPYETERGFYVLYQSAATGESITPVKE